MIKYKLLVPVTLYDGTHPEDYDLVDFKFLVKEVEFKSLKNVPEVGDTFQEILVPGDGDDRYTLELTVADRAYIENNNVNLIFTRPKDIHVNFHRVGVRAMYKHGWRWIDIPLNSAYETKCNQ